MTDRRKVSYLRLLGHLKGWSGKAWAALTGYRRTLGPDSEEYFGQIVQENFRNARIGLVGMVIFNLAAAMYFLPRLTDGLMPGTLMAALYRLYEVDVVAGVVLLVVSLAEILLAHPRRFQVIWTHLAVAGIVASGFAADLAHQDHSNHITNIQLALFVSALLVAFRPWMAVTLYGAAAVAAMGLVWSVQPDQYMKTLTQGNISFTVVASFVLSRIHFAGRVATFVRVKTIERQGLKLAEDRRQISLLLFSVRHGLTEREKDVLPLVTEGLSNQAIAERLFISLDTAKKHVYHIFQKTHVENRFQLARKVESTNPPGAAAGED